METFDEKKATSTMTTCRSSRFAKGDRRPRSTGRVKYDGLVEAMKDGLGHTHGLHGSQCASFLSFFIFFFHDFSIFYFNILVTGPFPVPDKMRATERNKKKRKTHTRPPSSQVSQSLAQSGNYDREMHVIGRAYPASTHSQSDRQNRILQRSPIFLVFFF